MKRKVVFIAVGWLLFLMICLLRISDVEPTWPKELEVTAPRMPVQGDRNIFFVETSCAVANEHSSNFSYSSGLVLTPRAACSIESAALAHPQRPVFLVHTCPLDEGDPLRGAPPFARALLALPNVFLWHAPFDLLFKNSPLADLIAGGALKKSKWPESHGSDILRYFLLWKYGGTYFDTDVLVLKSLGELRDFSCAENEVRVSAVAMDFSWEAPGRLLAQRCLDEVRLHFDPHTWGANGPRVITRAMKDVCGGGGVEIKNMTAEKCRGFQLLPTNAIYPVFYPKWRIIFHEHRAKEAMDAIKDSYAIHVWNALSKNERVKITSEQAYAQIARKVCPGVTANVGEFM